MACHLVGAKPLFEPVLEWDLLENDLENIFQLFVRIPQSNSSGTFECVCNQTMYQKYLDPFQYT